MRSNLTAITLGVSDLKRSIRFYRDALKFPTTAKDDDPVAFFNLNGIVLSVFPKSSLAEDATVSAEGSGFSGITLAHNTKDKEEVDQVLAFAKSAGVTIVKPAHDTFWGGYGGYFSDPDGYLWEVVWNPYWKLDAEGRVASV